MKSQYPNNKVASVLENISGIIWIGMIVLSIWSPKYNAKIFLTSVVWILLMVTIFYKKEK